MCPHVLDLTGEKCPVTAVRALNYLVELPAGSMVEIILDRGIPEINVPRSLKAAGYRVSPAQPRDPDCAVIHVQKP